MFPSSSSFAFRKLINGAVAGFVATIASHFAYGALFGSIYGSFREVLPMDSRLKGALFGLALWAGSYLGWLPALDILRPATRHPWRRNLIMILAHVVWGATLDGALQKLNTRD